MAVLALDHANSIRWSDEIINIFSPAPDAERGRLLPILKQLDPGNIQSYDQNLG